MQWSMFCLSFLQSVLQIHFFKMFNLTVLEYKKAEKSSALNFGGGETRSELLTGKNFKVFLTSFPIV